MVYKSISTGEVGGPYSASLWFSLHVYTEVLKLRIYDHISAIWPTVDFCSLPLNPGIVLVLSVVVLL